MPNSIVKTEEDAKRHASDLYRAILYSTGANSKIMVIELLSVLSGKFPATRLAWLVLTPQEKDLITDELLRIEGIMNIVKSLLAKIVELLDDLSPLIDENIGQIKDRLKFLDRKGLSIFEREGLFRNDRNELTHLLGYLRRLDRQRGSRLGFAKIVRASGVFADDPEQTKRIDAIIAYRSKSLVNRIFFTLTTPFRFLAKVLQKTFSKTSQPKSDAVSKKQTAAAAISATAASGSTKLTTAAFNETRGRSGSTSSNESDCGQRVSAKEETQPTPCGGKYKTASTAGFPGGGFVLEPSGTTEPPPGPSPVTLVVN